VSTVWTHPENAVAYALACARRVRYLYVGDRSHDVDAAIDAAAAWLRSPTVEGEEATRAAARTAWSAAASEAWETAKWAARAAGWAAEAAGTVRKAPLWAREVTRAAGAAAVVARGSARLLTDLRALERAWRVYDAAGRVLTGDAEAAVWLALTINLDTARFVAECAA
jgi:hypothetical protein